MKYRGALIDVSKLLSQLDRSDSARIDTETKVLEMKMENARLTDKNVRTATVVKDLNIKVKEYKEQCKVQDDTILRLMVRRIIFTVYV